MLALVATRLGTVTHLSPLPAATLAWRFGAAIVALSMLPGCGKCRGKRYRDRERLPGYELTVEELGDALAQEQSLEVLWDYASAYPEEDPRERPFEWKPYPYSQIEKLSVRVLREGNFKELDSERDNGECYDNEIQAPARAILRSENGDLDAEFDFTLLHDSLNLIGHISEPSGRLKEYMDSLNLPEDVFSDLAVYVEYDKRGVLQRAYLQVEVGYQVQLFTRVIFEGSRGQFED